MQIKKQRVPHTTGTLLMCEDDAGLRNDLARVAENWLAACRPFTHIRKNNPNAEAHILSAFGGHGLTVTVEAGPTWERIKTSFY